MKAFGPLEHFDYGELDKNCCCAICNEWRSKFRAMEAVETTGSPYKSGPSTADDDQIKQYMRARSVYLAALNRRELYCEMSYHAASNSTGKVLMEWIVTTIADRSNRTDSWWERSAPQVSMGQWLNQFSQERGLGVRLALVI